MPSFVGLFGTGGAVGASVDGCARMLEVIASLFRLEDDKAGALVAAGGISVNDCTRALHFVLSRGRGFVCALRRPLAGATGATAEMSR